ncbi:uncharacterized protein TNCV_3918971 [Trichonephila clavipes]|nr:uncharacterized protein TNCV_3918971 [Trichonephila clavipes]
MKYLIGQTLDADSLGVNAALECDATKRVCGSPVVKVSDPGRHVTSSSPVPIKTHRVRQRSTPNLLRAQTFSRGCGVVVRRGGEPAQVSSTPLDHGSK